MKGKENKFHIGIYGCSNVGKSSLINFLTNQQIAIVSKYKGTTTDPVKRSFELLDLGSVIFIDTAGVDDKGLLGEVRIKRTFETINTIDLALLMVVYHKGMPIIGEYEQQLIVEFHKAEIPFIVVVNKMDLFPDEIDAIKNQLPISSVFVSTKLGKGKQQLINAIKENLPKSHQISLLGDLVTKGDIVLLITPIDNEAPQGRLILPQVATIRNIIDNNAISVILKEDEVTTFLDKSQVKPNLVITDSQLFKQVDALIPKEILLTSFSILMARMKSNFEAYLQGVNAIGSLKDGDRVLMLENCSHQTSCDDIGRIKIPAMIKNFTGKSLNFDMIEGLDKLKRPITDYSLAIQCGGCMVTHKQLVNRLKPLLAASVPVTNYGMAIAYTQGIFERATKLFIKD